METTSTAGVGAYVKRAFLQRWNLLFFLGGVAASAISPLPDAVFSVVAAVEIVYLTGMVSNLRFRQAVDAASHKASKEKAAVAGQKTLQQIVTAFSFEARSRFEQLRNRCLEMRAIAQGVRGREETVGEDVNTSALDRMLWVFLRLLTSQQYLQRFLERANEVEIGNRLAEAQSKLVGHTGGDERIVRSLQDSVAVQQQRLDNFNKAKQNAEFVHAELDRIEAKIQAITEAAVNRQDPDFLTSQIDSVSESMQSTEKAINELQQITGFVDEMREPPAILGADVGQVKQG